MPAVDKKRLISTCRACIKYEYVTDILPESFKLTAFAMTAWITITVRMHADSVAKSKSPYKLLDSVMGQ